MISFPGNPVSTLISYALILRPYLRAGGPPAYPHAVASEQATLITHRGRACHRNPLTAPAAKRQFLRGTLAMVEASRNLPGGALPDILSGSHLLHRAAQADVLIELAPGTTYTGEMQYPTTAFASPITKRNTPRCSLLKRQGIVETHTK